MQKLLALLGRAVEAGGTGQGHLPLPVPAGQPPLNLNRNTFPSLQQHTSLHQLTGAMSSPTNRWAARNAALSIQPPQGRRPSGISTSPTFVGRTGPPPSNRPQNPTMARPSHGRTPSTSAMPQLPKTPTARNTRRPSATAAGVQAVGYGSTSPSTAVQVGGDGVTAAGAGAVGGTGSAVQNGVGSESTPLIPRAPRLHTLDGLNKPATTWTEFGVLCRSSVPLSAGLALENALSTINILVVTTLGESP